MKLLAKAVLQVMKEVKGMEKNSKVGAGTRSSYDGTKDQDVKEVFNNALYNAGLCMLPIGIEEETQIDRWQEENNYGKKQKQSVFTKVKTKYLLLHESGESVELAGYGHGVDAQDKGAGKATTYAMKNALLYSFVTPVGKIDDTDTTHSNAITTPKHTVVIPSEKLNACKNLKELQTTFLALTRTEQTAMETLKNELKTTLNGSN
jgi:hypothetical protein